MRDIFQGLNPRQLEAVTYGEGPLLVLAGAGSGKTRVLTYRVAYLVDQGVGPDRILAITFTNKAAEEMKSRLAALLGWRIRNLWVSTFHAACARILRRDAAHLGYTSHFSVYDDADQQTLIKSCLKELELDDKKYPPRGIAAAISRAKNELLDPDEFYDQAENFFQGQVARVYRIYQKRLRQQNAMDFDDLLVQTVRLFQEHPEVLDYYQDKFMYLLIDEYQDTNQAQYQLSRLLAQARRNICAVGDPDQSIYGWRGADITNILAFEEDYPDAKVVLLEENYRSTQNILEAANFLIRQNRERKEKNLWTRNPRGDLVTVYPAANEHDEAEFVAQTALEICRTEGRKLADCAVFYRTHAQSRVLEEVLMHLGVPYQIVGGLKFYERKEIKDLVAYLRLIVNPADNLSLSRIINVPRRGIGSVTWARVQAYAAQQGVSIYEVISRPDWLRPLAGRTAAKIEEFVTLVEGWRGRYQRLTVAEVVEAVLAQSGYLRELEAEKTVEAQTRIENLKEFISVAQEFDLKAVQGETAAEPTLEGFLSQVSLTTDLDTMVERENAITLMTLHAAKGLEFPLVFLIGMEEGVFPHNRALDEPHELEEERRLCYVGMTRAKEKLFLTFACQRTLYGETVYNPPSRFLEEIPRHLVRLMGEEEEHGKQSGGEVGEGVSLGSDLAACSFSAGDRVHHPKFGDGVVLEIGGRKEDPEIKVTFATHGVRNLLLRYAPLKRI
ncbi:MAG: DNA helicase PcrA [Clostridia bacterium]|nr:DNA helicase PcrA [Clostridia bacterium]